MCELIKIALGLLREDSRVVFELDDKIEGLGWTLRLGANANPSVWDRPNTSGPRLNQRREDPNNLIGCISWLGENTAGQCPNEHNKSSARPQDRA